MIRREKYRDVEDDRGRNYGQQRPPRRRRKRLRGSNLGLVVGIVVSSLAAVLVVVVLLAFFRPRFAPSTVEGGAEAKASTDPLEERLLGEWETNPPELPDKTFFIVFQRRGKATVGFR